MKNFKKAFTLTELLIALGVIAILCAILMPVIFNLMPNKNNIMAKKAYYTTQTIVSDLLNDPNCYPDRSYADENKTVGLEDGLGWPNCAAWDDPNKSISAGYGKFIYLFKDKLGLNPTTAFVKPYGGEISTLPTTVETSDGISWQFTDLGKLTYVEGTNPENYYIGVKVNVEGQNATENTDNNTFTMRVYADGKIEIQEEWAKKAVKVDKELTE